MAKIPVGQTIASAYTFLFGQIVTVVGIAGVPAILYAGADYVSRSVLAGRRADEDMSGLDTLVTLCAALVMLFAMSAAAVGIARHAMTPKSEKAPVYVPDGWTVLRMFGANLRFVAGAILLTAVAVVVSYGAFWLAGAPLDRPEPEQPGLALVLAAVVSWAAFLAVFVLLLRMGFLLPAVVASEAKGGIKRSYDLSERNSGRVFAITAALVAPILVLLFAAGSAVLRAALGADFVADEITPELMRRVEDAIAQQLVQWEIFNGLMFVLYAGLMYSGSAVAYRAAAAGKGET